MSSVIGDADYIVVGKFCVDRLLIPMIDINWIIELHDLLDCLCVNELSGEEEGSQWIRAIWEQQQEYRQSQLTQLQEQSPLAQELPEIVQEQQQEEQEEDDVQKDKTVCESSNPKVANATTTTTTVLVTDNAIPSSVASRKPTIRRKKVMVIYALRCIHYFVDWSVLTNTNREESAVSLRAIDWAVETDVTCSRCASSKRSSTSRFVHVHVHVCVLTCFLCCV